MCIGWGRAAEERTFASGCDTDGKLSKEKREGSDQLTEAEEMTSCAKVLRQGEGAIAIVLAGRGLLALLWPVLTETSLPSLSQAETQCLRKVLLFLF